MEGLLSFNFPAEDLLKNLSLWKTKDGLLELVSRLVPLLFAWLPSLWPVDVERLPGSLLSSVSDKILPVPTLDDGMVLVV